MADLPEQSSLIVNYFYHIWMKDLTNFGVSVEESVAFSATILKNIKQFQPSVLALLVRDFEQILPEISQENQFNVAIRLSRVLEHRFLDRYWVEQIFTRLGQKISNALMAMPDDMWRVRILTQLSQQCMVHVFNQLDPSMVASLKDTSRVMLGGEKVLAALGEEDHAQS